jgi:hypothetical protein
MSNPDDGRRQPTDQQRQFRSPFEEEVRVMAHKKKHGHPVPPGNRPQAGPPEAAQQAAQEGQQAAAEVDSFQEQDPKRRLGDFSGAGEHPSQQPGGLNDANHS